MTLGNAADAEKAFTFYQTDTGWEFFLGEGNFRVCYLINGVVYKVAQTHYGYDNENELKIYDSFLSRSLPDGLAIPLMTGYSIGDQIVIAAEYVPGELMLLCEECQDGIECFTDDCFGILMWEKIRRFGFDDACCYGNTVQHVDGTLYIVDLPG